MSLRSTLLATTAITASALLLAGCSSAASGADDTVRIGVVGASDPYWATYEKAAEDAGIDVEIVDFTDYNQPNPALSEGEIDLNQFQHLVYLSQYNTSADADLVPIGATAIYPLGLYSTQYDSVDDIPEGATVAVPDDESNQARGLLVLQSAGLVELKDGGSILSSIDDVDTAESKVEVTALDAALTATSLPDVAAAIVNNDYLEGAGLAASDAIAEDDPSDPNAIPYVNVFAARSEDADNETYEKLVDIYQTTQAVLDGVSEQSGGTAIFVTTPADELQSTLETVEKDTAAQAG
ncbi:MetQ/NlpA family ABC transporter substrate-binding protein [Rathayibacter sp. VKM Ac-2754]|uniref:MetQ/NlpA family ABC transporter substrate-binding protein n=1 Tax=Rathayibacter sp. VKM Ac-2754 TaxID=2609251 RepID=UPI001359D536|nr:MetQ/NlpA family ABC transporter substrate-binding protein [Rathayibacter sp. VKM Ac-2754]MWV59037.1 methionine ABC transporter substrate-binding protein [Rathayibacter sp. VKM Ac-2754]